MTHKTHNEPPPPPVGSAQSYLPATAAAGATGRQAAGQLPSAFGAGGRVEGRLSDDMAVVVVANVCGKVGSFGGWLGRVCVLSCLSLLLWW